VTQAQAVAIYHQSDVTGYLLDAIFGPVVWLRELDCQTGSDQAGLMASAAYPSRILIFLGGTVLSSKGNVGEI
jgi:hypothetical protein